MGRNEYWMSPKFLWYQESETDPVRVANPKEGDVCYLSRSWMVDQPFDEKNGYGKIAHIMRKGHNEMGTFRLVIGPKFKKAINLDDALRTK